jgi:peptidoglycan-N-acetylglucosamine deacetylase
MRLLQLFERFGIRTTWFVPGHSAETFPEQMKAVAAAGHEIGMHAYSHENPIALTPEQEEKIFDRCIEVMTLEGKAELPEIVPSRTADGPPARSWS